MFLVAQMWSLQVSLSVTWADFGTVKDICNEFCNGIQNVLDLHTFLYKKIRKEHMIGRVNYKKGVRKPPQLLVGVWDLHFKWSGLNFSLPSSLLSHLPCPLSGPTVILARLLPLLLLRFGSSINLLVKHWGLFRSRALTSGQKLSN